MPATPMPLTVSAEAQRLLRSEQPAPPHSRTGVVALAASVRDRTAAVVCVCVCVCVCASDRERCMNTIGITDHRRRCALLHIRVPPTHTCCVSSHTRVGRVYCWRRYCLPPYSFCSHMWPHISRYQPRRHEYFRTVATYLAAAHSLSEFMQTQWRDARQSSKIPESDSIRSRVEAQAV